MQDTLQSLTIRPANSADIAAIVALFAADELGGHGDTTDPAALPLYQAAFDRIEASANDMLYVAELDGEVVGTFQTTLIVSMTGQGAPSLRIEAVQTRTDKRGMGIGEKMIRFAVRQARDCDAKSVHLTSNLKRTDAHRFYRRLGFEQSHAGFKLKLEAQPLP
ncbi:GNAT family N-acetyltransferase [Pseudaminobacter arsenicus]|uniref:GNAT family N-acetyltransferase n=1 Tax=Borborobacter arsenicus TaxID=1851146 RepID=A0A432V912_9HYPH|nr:GNAT family N-acetyltransferase [Pseudaminobacter arsenicus]RUM98650.1 GNAT family N-acetyltransferase [Pseudaminobacter arsenicus]